MLCDQQDIDRYITFCKSKGVTKRGVDIVRDIIENPPARRVNTSSMKKNTTCRFPSRKVGFSVQAESWTVEWSSIYLKESDPGVLGYWDQPYHKPDLIYQSGKRKVRVPVTLDFFVISENFIGFEECKLVSDLERLVVKTPGRYRWSEESNCFEIPPLGNYLEGTGLSYRIFSDKDINPVLVDNIAFLYYFLEDKSSLEEHDLWQTSKIFLQKNGMMTISALEGAIAGLTRSGLLRAIAQGHLYVDLQNYLLSEPERVFVGADSQQLQRGPLSIPTERVRDRVVLSGSGEEVTESLRRYKSVKEVLDGKKLATVANEVSVSVRTLQRWVSRFRKDGVDGLKPHNEKKGNYTNKLPQIVESIITDVFQSNFFNSDNQNFPHIYSLIYGACREVGVKAPSQKSVRVRLGEHDDVSSKTKREGAKSAYQLTAYQSVSAMHDGLPIVTVWRFLQRCHIDHTQIDLQMISVEGVNLGKPWLTTIIDEYTGYELSTYLSFRSPSSVSVMSALRLMVKVHGVFPETVVVDGGKEFQSVYFEELMARYCVTVISREGKPRAGGPVERSFGALNTIFLDNLTGSNKLAKNIRQLSASHLPKNLAIWEPVAFYEGLLKYVDLFNCESIKSGGLSPSLMRDKSIERYGLSDSRKIKFDEFFLMNVLLPPKRRGTALRRDSPIRVNRIGYWHVCLKSISREGVSVEVRYDPFDLNYVFVYYKKKWLRFQATKPQHRRVDELDGAILAEVARHTLYVNEKEKPSGRANLAILVEDLNQNAKSDDKTRKEKLKLTSKKYDVETNVLTHEDGSNSDEWSAIDWGIDIPDSDGGC